MRSLRINVCAETRAYAPPMQKPFAASLHALISALKLPTAATRESPAVQHSLQECTEQLEALEQTAAECDLIANLASDRHRQEAFSKLAAEYAQLIHEMKRAAQAAALFTAPDSPPYVEGHAHAQSVMSELGKPSADRDHARAMALPAARHHPAAVRITPRLPRFLVAGLVSVLIAVIVIVIVRRFGRQ